MPRGRTPDGQGFGRPSKGTRMRICTRLRPELCIWAGRQARTAGMTLNDWLEALIEAEQARAEAVV